MGNQGSSRNEDKAEVGKGKSNTITTSNPSKRRKRAYIITGDKNESGGIIKDNIASYKGVMTNPSSQSSYSEKEKDSTNDITEKSNCDANEKESKEIKVPTNFIWKEGGGVVYLTGSFCNWNQKFLMNQINNKFELTLELPRNSYQYKFIVDNRWVFSKHHATCNDGKGNINNIIDTLDYPVPKGNIKNENNQNTNGSNKLKKSRSNSYRSEWPHKNDLHLEAMSCPDNYKLLYHMNRNIQQDQIGKNEYLDFNDLFYKTINNSFNSINIPPHVNLNHLALSASCCEDVMITSSTHRVRNKFVTIIYYKPVN